MRIQLYLIVVIGFLVIPTAFAANSVVIRPAGEWKNTFLELGISLEGAGTPDSSPAGWVKSATNPIWKRDRLGHIQFDERINGAGGGMHSDQSEFLVQASWVYGQDLLVNLTRGQRDEFGRKLDSPIDAIGNLNTTAEKKSETLAKHAKDEWALLLLKRILQHEAVKARYQVPLTEQRIQYVIRRFLVDVGRQLKSISKSSPANESSYSDLSKISNEQLFESVLAQIDLRTQADANAMAKKTRLGVGYGLDWSVKVEGLEYDLNKMLDADDEMIQEQKKLGEKHQKNWVDWAQIRIEFKEFPSTFEEFSRSVRAQVQKKQTEMLLSTPVLKGAWMGVLRKNIQLPLRAESLGIWPQSSEVLRIYNDKQRNLGVLTWTLEGPKNAEFAELVLKRLAEKGDAWVQEQFAKKFGAEFSSAPKADAPVPPVKTSAKRKAKAVKPEAKHETKHEVKQEENPAPPESLAIVFQRILDELIAESAEAVKKGELKITSSKQSIEFNEFEAAQSNNILLRQLLNQDDGGMRLFPVAQDSQNSNVPFSKQKKITLSFRLAIDQGTPVQKSEQISADAWAVIASGIREKALQFEIKRILYKLFQANRFEWIHAVCEQPEWLCLDASPKALTQTLMPEALAPDWEKATGVKSTLDLIDLGDETLIQGSLEKVLGFDAQKLNTILQVN